MSTLHRLIPGDLRVALDVIAEQALRPKGATPQQWLAFRLRRGFLRAEIRFWSSEGWLAGLVLNCDDKLVSKLIHSTKDRVNAKQLDAFWTCFSSARHIVSTKTSVEVKLGDYTSLFFQIVGAITRLRDGYIVGGGRRLTHSEVQARVTRLAALARELKDGLGELQYDLDAVELSPDSAFDANELKDSLSEEFTSSVKLSWFVLRKLDLPAVGLSDVLEHLASLETQARDPMQPLRVNSASAIADAVVFEVTQLLTSVVFDDASAIVFHLLEVLAGDLAFELPTRTQVNRRVRGVWEARCDAE